VKLTYLDHPSPTGSPEAPTVVAVHREALTGAAGLEELVATVRQAGAGRVVTPVGHYAAYPSGMEIGGTCWYRILPGYAGTDPISLATAVVQLGDLLDDLAAGQPGAAAPAVVGWGQGAVVALGAGLLEPGRVVSVACVDAVDAHLGLLPERCFDRPARPPVLLVSAAAGGDGERDRCRATLAERKVSAQTRPLEGPSGLAGVLSGWFGTGAETRPPTAERGWG
jgi:pimeloyl-ACP methyl ester carboxylesterase